MSATFVVSGVSLVIALVSLLVNVPRNLRRPRIETYWQNNATGDGGVWITVTARGRPIKITEVGLMHRRRSWRRQFPRPQLPGDVVAYGFDARESPLADGDTKQRWMAANPGRDARGRVLYLYAVGSGKVYFVSAHSKIRNWLASLG